MCGGIDGLVIEVGGVLQPARGVALVERDGVEGPRAAPAELQVEQHDLVLVVLGSPGLEVLHLEPLSPPAPQLPPHASRRRGEQEQADQRVAYDDEEGDHARKLHQHASLLERVQDALKQDGDLQRQIWDPEAAHEDVLLGAREREALQEVNQAARWHRQHDRRLSVRPFVEQHDGGHVEHPPRQRRGDVLPLQRRALRSDSVQDERA